MENDIQTKVGSVIIQQSQSGQYPGHPGQGAYGSDMNLNEIAEQDGDWDITCTFWGEAGGEWKWYTYTTFQRKS
jgi:hypothetical protein|tara:strand:- start:7 stop:228 length:222 start_codon:yes stop_codon:yes gene_type:complete